jgi:hypothetical protein
VEYPEFSSSNAPSNRTYLEMNTTVNHSVLSAHIKDKQSAASQFRTVSLEFIKTSQNYKITDKDHFKDLNVDGSIIFNRDFQISGVRIMIG